MATLCTRKEGGSYKVGRPNAESPLLFFNEVQTFYAELVFSLHWAKTIFESDKIWSFFFWPSEFLKRSLNRLLIFKGFCQRNTTSHQKKVKLEVYDMGILWGGEGRGGVSEELGK